MIQHCKACQRLQMPPMATCLACGSKEQLEWKEVQGRGRINGYCVQHDTRVALLKEDQPFNTAVVELAENPEIKFFSHLLSSLAKRLHTEEDWRKKIVTLRERQEKKKKQQIMKMIRMMNRLVKKSLKKKKYIMS